MAEPLSKRAQLLSSSIQTQAMFSGLLRWLSGSGSKKGTFWDFRPWEPHPRTLVEQLLISERPSLPSSLSPLSCLNLPFGQSCWDPSDNLSWGGQDYHIWRNFNFSSDTAQSHWPNRQYILLSDLLLKLHSRFLHPLQLKTHPPLPFLALCLSLLQLHCFPL